MTAPGSFWAVLFTALTSLVLPGSGHIIAGYWRAGIVFALLRVFLPFIAVMLFLSRPSLMAALPIAIAIWLVALGSAVHASVLVHTRGRRPGAPGPRRVGVIVLVMIALFRLSQLAQSTYFTRTYRP